MEYPTQHSDPSKEHGRVTVTDEEVQKRLAALRAIRGMWKDKPEIAEEILAMREEPERGTPLPKF